MTEIKIEKGIPVIKRKEGLNTKYPFKHMDIGDSFFVPIPKNGKLRTIQTATIISAKRRGMKAETRQVEGGIRVWRVA